MPRSMANIDIVEGGVMPDGTTVSCEEALRWGTINGAKAVGLDNRIGSLTPGKEADCILIRTDGINFAAWNENDPVASIILQAHPGNVDTVLVGGNIVKRNGRLCADEQKACTMLTEAKEHVAQAVESLGGFRVPVEALDLNRTP